ncbi:MAG: S-layer homology domain-containing protein [Bacillota bacterium]|nr:S-layer homology domain-containing protein [Bacillota bacterium]
MKKVLSLVLALVLVLGMIPTFADAHETGAELLKAHDFIVGDENGDLMVEKVLTRDEMTVLFAQMYGKEVEAAAFVAPADFTDVATFGWAANFISFAQASEWIVGYPDGTFQPKNVVTGKELLSAMMQVLGYEFEWETIVADAAAVGLTVSTEGPILRGAAFETMWIGVSAININGEEMTIGEKTGKIEPPAPVVVDLALVSVKAMNEGEVEVMFNNEIDEDLIDEDNFTVGTKTIDAVTLQEDGKTVIVEFLEGQLTNQTEYTLEIAEITDVNGFVLEDIEADFTVTDFTAPVVEEVIIKGNKKIDIVFSEPVSKTTAQILSNYKINDLLFGSVVSVDGRVVSLDLSSRLTDGVHTISVSSNVTDFAGFKVVSNNTEFVVAKDTTAPALASVVSATQKEVVIMFNEAVAEFDAEALVGGVAALDPETDDMTWTLTFTGALPLAGTEITLTDVMDFYGNTTDEITFNVVPTIDLVRPEVESVEVDAQDKIIVTFTKKVQVAGTDDETDLPSYFTLTDEDDDEVALTGAAYDVVDGKKVMTVIELTLVGGFEDGEYTLEITGLEDNTPLENKMIPYSGTVVVTDLTKPEVTKLYVTQPVVDTAGAIYVEFSEKVDAATALDKANYSYTTLKDGKLSPVSLGSSNAITLLGDAKTVKITVPKLTTTTDGTTVNSVTVINVTDLAGNKMVSVVDNTFDAMVTGVTLEDQRATAKNKVTLTVTGSVNPATVTAADFMIVQTGQTTNMIYVINAEYKEGTTENTIVLTLNDNLEANAEFSKNDVSYDVNVYVQAQNLADIYGTKVTLGPIATNSQIIADEIAPTVTKVTSAVWVDADDELTITLPLTEDVLFGADYADYLSVVVNNVKYAATASQVGDNLVVKASIATNVIGKTLKLTYYANDDIADVSSNNLANFEFTSTVK